jgi:prefoldin subunit 5
MSTINPEMRDLQDQVNALRDRVAKAEGKIDQVNRVASDTTRQTIWQFVIFTATMAVILVGVINYQTDALRREFSGRFDSVGARFDSAGARLDALEKRIDQSEKNMNARFDDMNARFEDLKQVVLARRK